MTPLKLPWAKQKNLAATKLAENLRDEKIKSTLILNAIDDGVILLDEQGIIRSFNPGASRITGWAVEDADSLSWESVLRIVNDKGEKYDDSANPFKRIFNESKTIHDNNANLLSKSDKIIGISLTVSPLMDESQQLSGAVAVLRDVAQQRAEEARRAEFISTASHEMRTPVAAIEGYLSLALNDKVATIDTRARDYLTKAYSSTQHLGELFQDLLTSAKAEDGRLINHPRVTEMGEFLEQLTSDLSFAARKKNLGLDYMIGSHAQNVAIDASEPVPIAGGGPKVIRPLYYVNVDPDRIREVITNLFDNACKYTEHGKITLGITGDENVVQVYVRDTGNGIAAEDIPHLFQKFYRVDTSATRTIGGTGLGLFICRKIVELYEGRIWVESKLGEGSTFYINLPRLTTARAMQMQEQQSSGAVQVVGALPTTPTTAQTS